MYGSFFAVTEFAKKTGDYGSLSAVDIRVMALTFQIEKENVGLDHIKTAPEKKVSAIRKSVSGFWTRSTQTSLHSQRRWLKA